MGALVTAIVVGDNAPSPILQAANEQMRRGLVRITRVLGCIILLFLIMLACGVELLSLAEWGIGAQFGSDVVGALLIVGVAYVALEAIRVMVHRQIAIERVTLGIAEPEDGAPEGEGSGAGARLGTLLPLVRVAVSVAIVVMASLMLLGQFCVSVLPLVAGAGVVGLAIGFGAQTLVKDIVFGIIFLIDDAFRFGE